MDLTNLNSEDEDYSPIFVCTGQVPLLGDHQCLLEEVNALLLRMGLKNLISDYNEFIFLYLFVLVKFPFLGIATILS